MERVQRVLALSFILSVSSTAIHGRELTLDQRVAAQRAIERVRFEHRIWPAVNPGAKPAFSKAIPDELLRSKVEDYLSKSRALETLWESSIRKEHLQAELDRMARDSHDPRMLREIFDALGNDPFLIAETLARQTLVDREIRERYASDGRYHGELRRSADAALAACASPACMRAMGGEYLETTWMLAGQKEESDAGAIRRIDTEDWSSLRAGLAGRVGGTEESPSAGRLSRVDETPDSLTVVAVLSESERKLTTATVTWPKRSFDAWWAEQRSRFEPRVEPVSGELRQPLISAPLCDTDDTWKGWPPPGSPPAAGDGTAVWTGTEMIVWGGYVNTGGRYDPSTDTWTPTSISAGVPTARHGHTAVWTGTEMIVWGGEADTLLGDGARYDPASDVWTPTSATGAPAARKEHTAVWTGTVMVVWGGINSIPISVTNTGSRYTPATDTWSATSTTVNVPAARYQHTAVWTGTVMVVWGGRQASGTSAMNSGGRLNVTANTWTTTSVLGVPAARNGHTAVWTGTEMIVWGGSVALSPQLNSGGRYNPTFNNWTATSTGANVPAPRDQHSAVWTGTEMIVWGGTNPSKMNSGGRYDPATDGWTATSLGANVPAARDLHAAVWTGTEMIVWGGCSNSLCSSRFGTGARYVPAADTWQPTAATPIFPTPRSDASTAWTGAEMIVWGGFFSNVGVTNSGARYDASTDSWTATSTGANVPSGRVQHSAVWTGTDMIVWGGSGSGVGSTGGRYDPVADTWNPTSTTGFVPTERLAHTAVWTGTEMIVWGGKDPFDFTPLGTGARYDPASDGWTGPTSAGPLPRTGHTAVWTGTEMIVWGGEDEFGEELADGGRFEPLSDVWNPTSTGANVPQSRADHTAVWTGSRMVVWGGFHNPFGLNTGGRYDPVHDTWTPTTTAGAPATRVNHNMVWTGTEMIVWGGDYSLNTGGRYDPFADTWRPTSMDHVPPPGPRTVAYTGAEMIVWSPLARYCACARVYLDADGDGHGVAQVSTSSCDGTVPSGYAARPDDCDDANAGAHPGALEVCNGIDDDCSGFADDGIVPPSAVAALGVAKSGPSASISWDPVAGATSYDAVEGSLELLRPAGDFQAATTGCVGDDLAVPSTEWMTAPAPGAGAWIVVRGDNCAGTGSYDEGSSSQQGQRDGGIAASSGACP